MRFTLAIRVDLATRFGSCSSIEFRVSIQVMWFSVQSMPVPQGTDHQTLKFAGSIIYPDH